MLIGSASKRLRSYMLSRVPTEILNAWHGVLQALQVRPAFARGMGSFSEVLLAL